MLSSLLGLVFFVFPGPQFTLHSVPFAGSDVLALELSVPNAWGVIALPPDDPYSHRDIQIAINNAGEDSLWVGALLEDIGGGMTRWKDGGPDVFAAALKPGTVYLEVSVFSGGPPPTYIPYAWTHDEQAATRIRRAAKHHKPAWETDDIVGYRVEFFHWGYPWAAVLCGRKPFPKHDLERAFNVLASIRLPDVPVLDPRQAVELALPFVPDDIRDDAAQSIENCGCCSRYQISTVPADSGFRVVVDIIDAPRAGKVVKSAVLDVERDGSVTRVAEDSR
ncbi:MAG: hypothetical protein OEX18_13300 [Candidatus Krumholzibacteria bacterium]|nr:hypothetical protein [Candidatus Krumholzibacteria bacterium]MDH5270549.1 hypothetical protein [Candidatus Krumholzibacteria bacterium]